MISNSIGFSYLIDTKYFFSFFLGKEVGMVSREDRNIPTRLAPNCHLYRLPPTQYRLLKKG